MCPWGILNGRKGEGTGDNPGTRPSKIFDGPAVSLVINDKSVQLLLMLEINKLGRGLSINIRNEFQIHLSIPPTHSWEKKKKDCLQIEQQARKTIRKPFQSDILEGACLQTSLAKFPGCSFVSSFLKICHKAGTGRRNMFYFVIQWSPLSNK